MPPLDYTAVRPVTLVYLSLADVSRWRAWWDSRGHEDYDLPGLSCSWLARNYWDYHIPIWANVPLHQTWSNAPLGTAVIFQLTFLLGLFGLCLVTPDGQRFLYLVFEVVSALATVGVTANVTSTLNGAGLGIIMVLMFIGRIGPLTLMVSLNNYKAKKADALQICQGRHHYRIGGRLMANRTIGILGLGIFGQSVLKTLQDQDVDIIAIDDHEDVINQYESMITTGIVGDITEMDLLDAADIGNCDTVVIATGENLESSVLAVMHCKALGVEHVIAKVKNEVTKEVLEKIGADLVILPEVEAGMSLAKMILFQHRIEVFQLDDEVVVVEFTVPSAWVGKSIRELAVRDQYQLNIIGYRDAEEQPLRSQLGPDFVWPAEVRVMAVTDNQYLDRIQDLLD